MKRCFNRKWYLKMIAAIAVMVGWFPAVAAEAQCTSCCSVCEQKVCHLEVDRQEIDVDCFEVECEDVCIPPVRFWWECGPIKRCGKVRTVNKLVTRSRTEIECSYDWSVVTICRACYRKIYRLRCQQLGLAPQATPKQVGLPAAKWRNDAEAAQAVRFRIRRQVEDGSFGSGPGHRVTAGMLTGQAPVNVADVSAIE